MCCSFPDQGSIVLPPPDAKAKKSTEYVESKGVLADKYNILLHFAFAHMSRVDGALPQHSSRHKALDLLAKEGKHRWSLFPPCGVLHNVYDVPATFAGTLSVQLNQSMAFGNSSWPCSGGNQSEIEPQDSIGSG